MDRFGMKDGIWICGEEFKGLSAVMRTLVMYEKKNENVTDKATVLYNYLTSEFGQTIQGIIDGFKEMQVI